MATPKPPNLYYYASGCVNKNFEGSSIEEGTSNNIFYPNNASYHHMAPHHPFPNPYAIDHRNQYENKSEQGNCGKSVSPILAILFVLFFVAFLATLIVWAIMTNGFKDLVRAENNNNYTITNTGGYQLRYQSNDETICQTEDCVLIASEMLKHMDHTVNPCDDFYQFACGNYPNSVLLPEDKRRMSPLDEMEIKLNMQLKAILEKPDTDSSGKSTKLARTFYRSCMNVDDVDERGLDPLKKLLQRLGDWPILNPLIWNEQQYVWEHVEANLRRKLGIESLLNVFIVEDFKDSSKRIITIDQPNLNLGSRDFYLKGKQTNVMKAYLQYMVDTFVGLGVPETEAQQQMSDVLDLEISLANITMADQDRRDQTSLYNPTNIFGLKKDVDDIKWEDWFKKTFPSQLNISDWEPLNVFGIKYLRHLSAVLRAVKKKTIANFQLWNVLVSAVDFLPHEYRRSYLKFQQIFTGVKAEMPRWEECVTATTSFLPWPVGTLYVKTYFQQNAKQEMEMLVANLRHAMREQIRNADWMDQETRRLALAKLSRMIQKVGYPDYVNNETKILEDFDGMKELSEDDYLENAVSVNEIKVEKHLLKLRQTIDKSEWSTQPAMVNAFYSPNANEITFPAGILQFPAFALNSPKYIYYPRIGAAIGHEITHGYDDEGRQYDQDGNLKGWWSEQTLKQFTERSRCFIGQYENITEPITGKHLNGRLTLGENIADNGGLKVAFKAYQIWLQQRGNVSEPKLPGFGNYTAQKIFFLAYANLWCENIRRESLDVILTIDPHTLANYRINVPLQNFPAFSEAWNCSSKTPMNPINKCTVW